MNQRTSHYMNQCWPSSLTHIHVCGTKERWVKWLRPCDVCICHSTGSSLVQVKACHLMAPSHYLNVDFSLIRFSGIKLRAMLQGVSKLLHVYCILYHEFENYILLITATSPRGLWSSLKKPHLIGQQANSWTWPLNLCCPLLNVNPWHAGGGPSYLGLTRSISWLLMSWLLTLPGHQQPWYWLCRIYRPWSYLRKDFKCMCHIIVE